MKKHFLLSALCFLLFTAQTIEVRKNGKVVATNREEPAGAVRARRRVPSPG
jgi:hypothetical protein